MEKLFDTNDLPDGPLERYLRDIYAFSKKDISFSDFKKQWEIDYDNECIRKNKENPIEYNKTIYLSNKRSVFFFKRKGEEWYCSETDMAPNGGWGHISLAEALKKCNIKDIKEIL